MCAERPWFAFIESNTSGTGRLFVECSLRHGYRPILFAKDPCRYPFVGLNGLTLRTLDTSNIEGLVASCLDLAAEGGLIGVGSSSEYFVEAAARVARACDKPGPDPLAVAACRDKRRQRERLRLAGIPQPSFRALGCAAQPLTSMARLTFPVVAKPCFGSGSFGVKLCEDEVRLADHVTHLLAHPYNERGMAADPCCLVEEYIAGEEFSIEIFDGKAIAVARKYLGPEPSFVEIGHDLPADLDSTCYERLVDVAISATSALGLGWGPAHVEVRLGPDGPCIIEVNPRLAGGMIPELIRLGLGIDLIDATIRRQAGEEVEILPHSNLYACIRFLLINHDIMRLDDVREWPEIADVVLYEGRSSSRVVHGDFRDRIGHVIALGRSSEIVRYSVSRALSHIIGH